MTETLREPVERALELLREPPGEPDMSGGYLDLLGPPAQRFLEQVREMFEVTSSADALLPQGAIHRLRRRA